MSVGVLPQPFQLTQPIFLQPAAGDAPDFLHEVQSSLKRMKDLYSSSLRMPAPTNPCAQDLARTGCKDVACLKKHAESLAGSCAEMLLRPMVQPPSRKVPEPSPAPMPRGSRAAADMVSKLLGLPELSAEEKMPSKMMHPPKGRAMESPLGEAGFFTVTSTDEEGHTSTFSGPIGVSSGLPPELAQMTEMLPPIGSLLGAFAPSLFGDLPPLFEMRAPRERPTAFIGDAPPRVARMPSASIGDAPSAGHPCAEEIMACEASGAKGPAVVKQCLLDHLEQLSPRCKCLMNQLEGPQRMQQQLPPAAKAAAAPVVHMTSAAPPMRVVVVDKDATISMGAPPDFAAHEVHGVHGVHGPPPGPHGGACALMMGATVVLFLLLLRKCIACCCKPSATSNVAIAVPPEAMAIKLVEPLRSEEIKAVAK